MTNFDEGRPALAEPVAAPRPRAVGPLLGAVGFLLCFLAVGPAVGAVTTGTLPLPGEPEREVYEYLSANTTGSLLTGVLQTLSVAGLAVFIMGSATKVGAPHDVRRRAAVAAGVVAVTAMLVSATLAILNGLTATSASMDTVVALRNGSFIAGGVVHVVALGLFVLALTRMDGWTRPVRTMGWIAAVPAVLSILSVFWFYASVLLLIGRVLCMVCLLVAGVSLARGRTPVAGR